MNLHRPVTFAYTRLSAGFVHAMRFATLGTSPEARRVAQTLVALGHTWTAAVGSGTGMGLSMAYNAIVTLHDCQPLVDSTEGVGTTFTAKLPV